VSALLLRDAEFAKYDEADGREDKIDNEKGDWITVADAPTILHESPRWIFRNSRRLPFVRKITRKNWLISRSELLRWIDTRKP
jgi:hypothetical protein